MSSLERPTELKASTKKIQININNNIEDFLFINIINTLESRGK